MIARESALKKGLPKDTTSICPECSKAIPATIYEKDGMVLMDKECPDHGKFSDTYWSDVDLYLQAERYAHDGVGFVNPAISKEKVHVDIGGQDVELLTHTVLANVDLTNRCNMRCPICFANANAAGYVYEPSFDEVVTMLEALRAQKPVPVTSVQFSGGEPTIYPDFIKVLAKANELGFAQIQVATNGIAFANDLELLKQATMAGMNTIYLSFDGVTDDIYLKARDRPMFNVKLKVLDNIRKLDKKPSVVLVPTIVRGLNDHQLGDILNFAIKNSDIVRGVNFQPVAFTGRITQEEREKGRYTLTDMVHDIGAETGYTQPSDWYPVPVVAPVSMFVSSLLETDKVTFTAHPQCGLATYLYTQNDGKIIPITRFVDVEAFVTGMNELAVKMEGSRTKFQYKVKAVNLLKKCILKENIPDEMSAMKFLKMMDSVLSDKRKTALSDFSWKMMFVGGMHFQDSYNYDIERTKRCAIHYITPDLKIYPFCTYNGGPTYREATEMQFSIPLADWKAKHGSENV